MKEKCNCKKAICAFDNGRRGYFPCCVYYSVWLDYDRRHSLLNLGPEHAYRPEICFENGKYKEG